MTGLFGKIPAVGDFVSRGFSPQLREGLDALLQAALVAAAKEGGDARALMEKAPPAMLAIRPGALAPGGFTGLWMPSQDRVGRVFPLCVGLEIPTDQAQAPLPWPSAPLMRALYSAVVQGMRAGSGPDELVARLPSGADWQRLAAQDVPFATCAEETLPRAGFDAARICLAGPEPAMTSTARALAARLPWGATVLGYTVAPDGSAAHCFASREVPPRETFAALWDGRWAAWGWTSPGLT